MRVILIILVSILPLTLVGQQDPLYSQYLFNQAIINPAYTGVHDILSATLVSRNQWLGLEGAPQTNALNVHSSLFNNRIGLGLTVVNDRLGVNENNEVTLAYAYKVRFDKTVLAFGLQGGMTNFRYDFNDLEFEFFTDPSFQPVQDGFTKFNFGTGLFLSAETFYLGASIPRITDVMVNDGVLSSTRYKRHVYISSGIVLDQVFAVKVKPTFLMRMIEGEAPSIDIGANVLLDEVLWLGAMVRNFNTYGFNAQLTLASKLRLGYSFELPSKELIAASFGTHEFMVGIDLVAFSRQGRKKRYF